MLDGVAIGIVVDNVDPDGMHRVKVRLPVESVGGEVETHWCRMMTPMGGKGRGLVILPEIGTEVVLCFSYKSLQPYVIGGVYNGSDDAPEPYKNDDEKNNLRVFWSRNDHMVIFDDTEGEEKVQLGAQATERMDVTSGPIHQTLDSAEKVITEYCDKDTFWEASQTISIKCTDLNVEAGNSITLSASSTMDQQAGADMSVEASGTMSNKGATILVNCGVSASPQAPLATPAHKHPPV